MMWHDTEKQTLRAVLETLIPALPAENGDDPRLFDLTADDFDLTQQFIDAMEQVADTRQQQEIRLFLRVLESGLLNRAFGQARPFGQLSRDERTALLLRWGDSSLPLARKAFQAVKRLGLALFYVQMPAGQPHPAWAVFNYGDPPGSADPAPRPITPLMIDRPTTLYTDVLVIGSGAGGGVVAGELSAAGLDVIVAEKGGYYTEADFHGREMEGNRSLYERQGVLPTSDLGLSLLAGSALGGGTLINWSASLATPDYVLREWHDVYGFRAALSADYQQSMAAVAERLHVHTAESAPNMQNAALERGCQQLDYGVAVIPRNVQGCEECGFCTYGCPFGAKQSTLKTYLQDAADRGARILVQAEVERVLHRNGRACGAELVARQPDGRSYPVTVEAKVVVVAAGSLHTPAILLRSGLGNAHIGEHLHLHPTTVIYSLFDTPMRGWLGAPMTRVSQHFANLDGHGYGVWLETAPVHPGMAAQAFPWRSGQAHKRNMQRLENFGNIIILTRDYEGGRVKVGQRGEPRIHYRLSRYDGQHLLKGLAEAFRIHRAAGARLIYSPQYQMPPYDCDQPLEPYLEQVQAAGFRPNTIALFSAHQMSSCRIGGSSAVGALTPEGETYEIQNLFVADGSVLPTAAGVNPMLTIMALAHYIAQQIKTRF